VSGTEGVNPILELLKHIHMVQLFFNNHAKRGRGEVPVTEFV